jgi:hypothetical protein
MLPTIFDLCQPRDDVLKGALTEADFAADLAQVLRGEGPKEYRQADLFFANTYPTRGLKNLLANVCARLSGGGGEVAAIFRLDTSYGGGKTHGLIALTHAARGMKGVANIEEFVDPALVPPSHVRVAAFDGENADPANGRAMGEGILAFTPWGEIAYALAGVAGYERVRRSDEQMSAPGSETIRELFGNEPTLILLDELSVYLRKVQNMPKAKDQLTAFMTSLFKAVESTPNAALVYTLAIGKGGIASDAYSQENQFIAERMAEAESVSARKATLLNPTEDDETVQVLRRRLFQRIDDAGAEPVIAAYQALWQRSREALIPDAIRPETLESFRAGYPFHPEVLETLTSKTATLGTFQRVRGMLRLLARTIAYAWKTRPTDATALHLHHVDPGFEPIRQEILTRLQLSLYRPVTGNDIASIDPNKKSLAQEIDAEFYSGLPPYASYVARTIFMHSLAFYEQLKGLSPEHLRFSIVGPYLDVSFVDDARTRFRQDSAYLDDKPGAPLRFLAEANLTQIIRRQEQHTDPGAVRAGLNDRIKEIFKGQIFETVPFPGGPYDVPDEMGDGRPKLVMLSYDAEAIGAIVESVPPLIERIYTRKGADGSGFRALKNNLVFIVADEARKDEMRRKMVRRLALKELVREDRLAELAPHQREAVRGMETGSEAVLATAIQQCYRHLFYPSKVRLSGADVDLAHSAVEIPSASEKPGSGQPQVIRALRDLKKLRLPEDEPDSPAYIRDRTTLKKGEITTLALRDEFRRDPNLPILIGDDIFVRAIRRGIETGEYVYRRGDLLYGPGDPGGTIIQIDEQAMVFTMAYAMERGLWPRPAPKPTVTPEPEPESDDKPERESAETAGIRGERTEIKEPPPANTFTAEGVLKEALTKLWEQARVRKVEKIGKLTIRLFDAGDAFRLLGAVGAVAGADKSVKFEGGYETADGSTLEISFHGSVDEAKPLKEFLDPQLRAASEKSLESAFELKFEAGLVMQGNAAETLTERLARFASGAAYVSATAEIGL